MMNRIGKRTAVLPEPPVITAAASAVGKKEGQGPLGDCFDLRIEDSFFGEKTWEQAESRLQRTAMELALQKAGLRPEELDCVFAGDLLNQCIGSTFGLKELNVPFFGVYGACSTMAESMALAAMTVSGGFARRAAAVTSSHFCSAERQFRLPLEYGGQRTPTAQWTVTGAGAAILSQTGAGPRVTHVTAGRIVDPGIRDANNMGAAMAPAAYDTISAHLEDLGMEPGGYDRIFTGDLGAVGSDLLRDLFARDGTDISPVHRDCGVMMFDRKRQDVHAGGSGCGCSAAILCGHILPELLAGRLRRVLFCATGALLSTVSSQQGQSIPGICCAVAISSGR